MKKRPIEHTLGAETGTSKSDNLPDKQRRLTAEDLNIIRANADWKAVFYGLGFEKSEKKSKPDDFWACSKINEEKTPSFHMVEGGRWYDFSANVGGGTIELIQKLENVNCYTAAQILLDHGWSYLPEKLEKPENSQTRSKRFVRESKQAVEQVVKSPASSEEISGNPEVPNPTIRQDLMPMCDFHKVIAERGISEETADKLGVGFLAQGRSPLRGRIVFQVRDARAKKKGTLKSVILSHLGRSVTSDQQPKYLMYEGFQKSLEILGQDRLWMDPATVDQIKKTGCIVLTEGPFDWAKCIEAGLLNVGAVFGSHVSEHQAQKVKQLTEYHDISRVRLAFDRDEPGQVGAERAREMLESLGLEVDVFDWEQAVGNKNGKTIRIPENFHDLADLDCGQLTWLRTRGLI